MKNLERVVEFWKPFYDATNTNSKEKGIWTSEVVLIIASLKGHVQSMNSNPHFKEAAKNILSKMELKFRFIYDKSHTRYDGIFLAASYLDPRFRLWLKSKGKNQAIAFLRAFDNSVASNIATNATKQRKYECLENLAEHSSEISDWETE